MVSARSSNAAVTTGSQRVPEKPGLQPGERQVSLYRVGALTLDGQRQLCLIRSVSPRQMTVRTYSDVAPGTRIAIEMKHGESVAGTARWVHGDNVSVIFDDPVDVARLLAPDADRQPPRMPRVDVGCLATVRSGATVHQVQAINISQGGLKFRSPTALATRDQVVVTLPGLNPLDGLVCWADDGCFGVRLNHLMSLDTLVGWLKSHRGQGDAAVTHKAAPGCA